jgi:hypothetical protein
MNQEGMQSVKWAIERMIALRKAGEAARFRVSWADRDGVRHYRLEIRRESGVIERPISPLPLGSKNAVEESSKVTLAVGVLRPAGFYWTRWEGHDGPEVAELVKEQDCWSWYRTGSDESWAEGGELQAWSCSRPSKFSTFLREILSGPLSAPESGSVES